MGTQYANKIGIKVTMPKWGVSKGEYFFDKERNVIAKGLSSIKFMGASIAEELYALSQQKQYKYFMDLLSDLDKLTSLNTRQLEILIKIDFFSDFGNQRELLRLMELFYDVYNKGQVKQISKEKVDGTPLEPIIQKYATGVTKNGGIAKKYTILDVESILKETESAVKAIKMSDLSDVLKVKNFADVMGYVGYVSGKDEDRRKLYITDVFTLNRKRDGKQFGYSILTKSIGSGKESRFTVFNRVYNTDPIHKGDIILCKAYERDGQYYTLTGFSKIY